MQRSYEKWYSPALGREMELLWFGWSGYPVIAFPTSMGRFFQYEDSGTVAALAHKLEAGQLQLCCVDSVDTESWYNEGVHPAARAPRHEQYDAYLRGEVVPFVRDRAQRHDLGAFGCSFGGYHTANFAGRFTDGYWDDGDYFNSPAAYIPNMDAGWIAQLARIDWVLATGEFDALAPDNRNFDAILTNKGIPHHTEIWPGVNGHDWNFWNDAVVRLL